MKLEFALNDLTTGPFCFGYAAVRCSIRNLDATGDRATTEIVLRNADTSAGGQVVFYVNPNAAESDELNIQVPNDGSPLQFFVGGKYKRPSSNLGDATIVGSIGGAVALQVNVMVRVRKNAINLSDQERNRFLKAFQVLITNGGYARFLSMHDESADLEIHGRASFLPWHRVFLLDLERNLQRIDPSVAIPYWDFQNPAENIFSQDFMGATENTGTGLVKFRPGHSFEDLRIVPGSGLARRPIFNELRDRANVESFDVTMQRGPGFERFVLMEGNPHGAAHLSFDEISPISDAGSAPEDPLFFMLHANVDRLWAEWQTIGQNNARFDGNDTETYNPQHPRGQRARVGDFLGDTMWPWNGIRGNGNPNGRTPRPVMTAPGGPLIDSPTTPFPGGKPTVLDTIDYQGRITGRTLNFDYDSVPFLNSADFAAGPGSAAWAKVNSTNALRNLVLHNIQKHTAILTNFKNAVDKEDVSAALSRLNVLDEEESQEKATSILMDEASDAGVRALALSRLVPLIADNEDLISYILQLASRPEVAENLRKEALRALAILEFSSFRLKAMKAEVSEVFRGMVEDKNSEIRRVVIAKLARSKDEFIQRRLTQGLEQPETALVSEDLAIHLLGMDIKAVNFPLMRQIVANSSNNRSRANALFLLGSDPGSKDLLVEVFKNKRERFDVRKNSLLSLKRVDEELFAELTQKIVNDPTENEDIRITGASSLLSTAEKPNAELQSNGKRS